MTRSQGAPPPGLAAGGEVRLSEVIGALSYALDLTEGQPVGHAVRTCAIGMRLAEAIALPEASRESLFYALLIKDAGCSTNASRLAELFTADDRAVKRDLKLVDHRKPRAMAAMTVRAAGQGSGALGRVRAVRAVAANGNPEGTRDMYALRCERGADIARMIDLGEEAAEAIRALDEHWDGGGHPLGVAGEDVPLLGRILGLAQSVEVFTAANGPSAAYEMAEERSGTWFDPALVRALASFRDDAGFWGRLLADGEHLRMIDTLEPLERVDTADDERLDRIAEAFARVIDAKSPFTASHSAGVAQLAVGVGHQLGASARSIRDIRRAGLLHDIGKLGVSNRILDKPGKLDADEWAEMKRHTSHTFRILDRVSAFRPLAKVAAAHHERLDGSGYHLGLDAERLPPMARILAVADVCEALSAKRPYRDALPKEVVLEIMGRDVPHALDPEMFAALQAHLDVAPYTP